MRNVCMAVFALSLMLAASVRADSWARVSVDDNGVVIGVTYFKTSKAHALGENEYPYDYAFPAVPKRYWKKQGNDWVEMTAQEKAAVDEAIQGDESDYDQWDDPKLVALVEVVAEELGLNANQMKAKLKAKIKPDKVKKGDK